MNRRDFVSATLSGTAALWIGCASGRNAPRLGSTMTVRGAIAPDEMGVTLPHEHVTVDFAPASRQATSGYNRDEAFDVALPYLRQARAAGCRTLVDATPAYLGRDPILLRALSEETGLHIITNTGYYGAREDVHVPEHAFTDSIDDLAAVWIGEWTNGIGETGIRPGFIKIGVDSGPLSEMDTALIQAAARTHRATGLTIASHTASATPAFEQMEILLAEGVHASSWIWVHAHAEDDTTAHIEAARQGAWVEFDGIGPGTIERHVELVMSMRTHRLLTRVLISQDAGWYSVGEPGGGDFRGYTSLFESFLPALREAGLEEDEIDLLVSANPADAYRIRIREYHA